MYSLSPPFCALPLNSEKICAIGLRTTLARTLRRPRWGMPSTMDSTPRSVTLWGLVVGGGRLLAVGVAVGWWLAVGGSVG
jgi:hypothetical protein